MADHRARVPCEALCAPQCPKLRLRSMRWEQRWHHARLCLCDWPRSMACERGRYPGLLRRLRRNSPATTCTLDHVPCAARSGRADQAPGASEAGITAPIVGASAARATGVTIAPSAATASFISHTPHPHRTAIARSTLPRRRTARVAAGWARVPVCLAGCGVAATRVIFCLPCTTPTTTRITNGLGPYVP